VDTPGIFWGTLWASGVVCPASPAYTADELARQLQNAGATAIVTQTPTLSVALAAAQMVGLSADRILLMGDPDARLPQYTTIGSTPGQTFTRAKLDPKKDLDFLVYSSGTTGLPKSVNISHYNIVSNVLQLNRTEGRYLSQLDERCR
jgi:4-coumarate--CoA ligase